MNIGPYKKICRENHVGVRGLLLIGCPYQKPRVTPIKYRFEIWYQTKYMKQTSDFLSKCDLGTDCVCLKEVITFNYTKEEKPIDYFKGLIKQAMESGECTLVQIEGGKIE